MGFPRNDFITEAKLQGRSQQFITEALRYADVLDGKGLPVIFDTSHLAFMLNMSHRDLVHIAFMASVFYKYFAIKKRNGGYRRIMAPYMHLRQIQVWINKNILSKVQQPEYVTAFVKGRNTQMNARMNENRAYVLKVDLSNKKVTILEKTLAICQNCYALHQITVCCHDNKNQQDLSIIHFP